MVYRSKTERSRRRTDKIRIGAILVAGLLLLTVLDFPLLHLLYFDHERSIEDHDWYRALRVLGFIGTWLFIGIVFMLHDRNRHRGLSLIFATICAGALAEFGKMFFGRERPVENGIIPDGWYHFRPLFSGVTESSNLGLPSSHAAVAFAGCLILGMYLNAGRWVLFMAALGCGITRMLTGAHFATDVYLGALIGWLMAWMFARLTPTLERNRPTPF